MVAVPTRPNLKDRFEKKRESVLDACATVFAERGFNGAGIDDLKNATGLTAGGLYHYIGSKDEALSEILGQLMRPLLEESRRIVKDSDSARDRLRSLIRLWVDHVATHQAHMLVFSQERHLLELDQERWRELRKQRREFERILGSALESASAELNGKISDPSKDKQGKLVLLALLGMVNYTPLWFWPHGDLTPAEIADGYYGMVISTISPERA